MTKRNFAGNIYLSLIHILMLILRIGGMVSGGFDQIYNLYNEQVYRRKSCGLITGKEWLQFFCVPVFTVVGFILMFRCV